MNHMEYVHLYNTTFYKFFQEQIINFAQNLSFKNINSEHPEKKTAETDPVNGF